MVSTDRIMVSYMISKFEHTRHGFSSYWDYLLLMFFSCSIVITFGKSEFWPLVLSSILFKEGRRQTQPDINFAYKKDEYNLKVNLKDGLKDFLPFTIEKW